MAEHTNDNGWTLKAPYNAQGISFRPIKGIKELKAKLLKS
jgi:hypothetical protein